MDEYLLEGRLVRGDELPGLFPNTSLPAILDPGSLEFLGLLPVQPVAPPVPGPNQLFERDGVEQVDGAWRQRWRLRELTAEQIAEELSLRRRDLIATIERFAQELGAVGLAWDFGGEDGVLHLQLRGVDDKANWLTLRGEAAELIAEGQGAQLLPIRTAENRIVMRPATVVRQVLQGLSTFGFAVMGRTWALKDQAAAAKTPEALAAIDITAGWPA